MTNHFYGHQKAVVRDNLVIAVLSFSDHIDNVDVEYNEDYDVIIDLCNIDRDAFIGDAWDGNGFKSKPYPSWLLLDSIEWVAPVAKPGKNFVWDEESLSWNATEDSVED
jgi:hypothetical protein